MGRGKNKNKNKNINRAPIDKSVTPKSTEHHVVLERDYKPLFEIPDENNLVIPTITARPKYEGPELMTEEYCHSPHFTASYDEALALKYGMAERCVDEGREVVFVRGLPYKEVDIIDANGVVTSHKPWTEQPKGETLVFKAEAKNPKTGEWSEKKFNITTAEKSALVDGSVIIEGTKVNGIPYTISALDFSKELNQVLRERGLHVIEDQHRAPDRRTPEEIEAARKAREEAKEKAIAEAKSMMNEAVESVLTPDEQVNYEIDSPSETISLFKIPTTNDLIEETTGMQMNFEGYYR